MFIAGGKQYWSSKRNRYNGSGRVIMPIRIAPLRMPKPHRGEAMYLTKRIAKIIEDFMADPFKPAENPRETVIKTFIFRRNHFNKLRLKLSTQSSYPFITIK